MCRIHKWDDKIGVVRCLECQAVGLIDKNKDPLAQGETAILKPPLEDWKQLSTHARHKIYEKNKNHILISVQNIGIADTCLKWSINVSTFSQLMSQWRRGSKYAVVPKEESQKLPPLPAFDSTWTKDVQIEWLKTYRELVIKN